MVDVGSYSRVLGSKYCCIHDVSQVRNVLYITHWNVLKICMHILRYEKHKVIWSKCINLMCETCFFDSYLRCISICSCMQTLKNIHSSTLLLLLHVVLLLSLYNLAAWITWRKCLSVTNDDNPNCCCYYCHSCRPSQHGWHAAGDFQ